ncbi:membrane progestin receptor beta-like isoform 2-T3 [Synchiropus picturatus]
MVQVSFSPPTICLALLPGLRRLLPSLPPTVRDVDVPPLFRERYILSGYRPVGQSWRCYVLSLFQLHNETLNVWSHLLAALCITLRFLTFSVFQGGVETQKRWFLRHSSAVITVISCRVSWDSGCKGPKVFLPASAFLAWLSCSACCFAKLRFQRPYPLHRKLCQVGPMGVAYLLDISPVIHRLSTQNWSSSPAMPLHLLQVVLFLLAAFFFSCPIPERFSPGRYDIIGHGHQLFHLLLSLCTLAQQEALYEDFLVRRPALIRMFGEERILLACVSFICLTLCCVMTVNHMSAQVVARLKRGHR